MTRLQAFLINALAFVLLAAALVGLALWLNPGPLFHANGVMAPLSLTLILAAIVGPGLMLFLFRPGKKGLMIDVTVLILLQVLIWGFGARLVWQERPAWLVIALDRIVMLRAGEVDASAVGASVRPPAPGDPRLVVARLPDDPDRQQEIMFGTIQGGPDIDRLPELYDLPGAADRTEMQARSRKDDILPAEAIKLARDRAELVLVPLVGSRADLLVGLDTRDWQITHWWNIDPWQRNP